MEILLVLVEMFDVFVAALIPSLTGYLQRSDSTLYSTKANYKKGMDSLGGLISAAAVDTLTISTKKHRQKGIDSLVALIPSLTGYLQRSDSTIYSTKANYKKGADSLGALIATNTSNISTNTSNISLKINIADSANYSTKANVSKARDSVVALIPSLTGYLQRSDSTLYSTKANYKKGADSLGALIAAKQSTISLTTTGTSGAATFVSNTLNIPQYGGSSVISGLTAASATNAIDNTNYLQEWRWNSLTSGPGFKLSSTSTAATGATHALLHINLSGANATSTQTTYGLQVMNTHSGTASTNIAGYFSATGGATGNYAGIFDGFVGVGTATPAYLLHVKAGSPVIKSESSTSSGTAIIGATNTSNSLMQMQISGSGAGAFGSVAAGEGLLYTDALGMSIMANNTNGVIKISTGGSSEKWRFDKNGGFTNALTAANTTAVIDLTSTTKGALMPRMTKTQRDAISSPAQGLLVFVTDNGGYLAWYNSGWFKVSSVTD